MARKSDKVSIPDNVRVLQDIKRSGKERPWRGYKLDSLELAKSYKRNGDERKYQRVKDCGGYLEFAECPKGHEKKLMAAKFCQVRLCPMCSARRSTLVFQNLREVLHAAKEREKLQFVFLTLTARTVSGDKLKEELTKYFESWSKLAKRRPFRKSIVGWFRALEITHNWRKATYHPHFHCILAVKPSYFSHGYVRQATWAQWWKESMQLDYTPIVDVRRVKPRKKKGDEVEESGAIFEVAKYSVKSKDFLIPENRLAQDEVVEILDDAMRHRRLVAYGGLLKSIRKELRQADEERHNLIKVGEDQGEGCTCSICNTIYEEVAYKWHVGYKEYVQLQSMLPDHIVTTKGKLVDKETGEVVG